MMLGKAILHEDWTSGVKIMKTINPKSVKKIGREVKNSVGKWDDKLWNLWKWEVMVLGLILKFGQTPTLRKSILATDEKFMVEASPWDKVWGAGLTTNHADVSDPSKLKEITFLDKH